MKVSLVENHSKETIGELILSSQPRNGEWIEFNQNTYSIHRIIHITEGMKLMVIGVR